MKTDVRTALTRCRKEITSVVDGKEVKNKVKQNIVCLILMILYKIVWTCMLGSSQLSYVDNICFCIPSILPISVTLVATSISLISDLYQYSTLVGTDSSFSLPNHIHFHLCIRKMDMVMVNTISDPFAPILKAV